MFRNFHNVWSSLVCSINICCGLNKVDAKSRARVYFEKQILALLLPFHKSHNLSRNKFVHRSQANQPISAFISLSRNKCFCLQGNHVARQVEGFCFSYFAASKMEKISTDCKRRSWKIYAKLLRCPDHPSGDKIFRGFSYIFSFFLASYHSGPGRWTVY